MTPEQKLRQLENYAAWEEKHNPSRHQHVTRWAVNRIKALEAALASGGSGKTEASRGKMTTMAALNDCGLLELANGDDNEQ